MSLTHLPESIKSEIKVNSDGKGFLSMRGVARLIGIDPKAIRHQLAGGEQKPSKLLQMLMVKGFKLGEINNWNTTGIPDMAVSTITKYYAYKAGRFCKPEAELIDELFTAMGVRRAFQLTTGYVEPVPQIPVHKPKELPPKPPEPNREGLIVGIDYPDPLVLDSFEIDFDIAANYQLYDELRATRDAKAKYLEQFDRRRLADYRIKEENKFATVDPANIEYRKLAVLGKLKHLKQPLPFDVHNPFFHQRQVVYRYKTDCAFLKPSDIKRMFEEAEIEGIGKFDPETNCFYPIHLLPHVIEAYKALEEAKTKEDKK